MTGILRLSSATPAQREFSTAWEALISDNVAALHFPGHQSDAAQLLVFPGAFNPVHEGHLRMAELAANRIGAPTHFEISVTNVDKATIDKTQALSRVKQFAGEHHVLLTRAPTFVEKAAVFPHATFVVGVDTILRIADVRYYGSTAKRDDALASLAGTGCKFVVFGRRVTGNQAQGRFHTLDDLVLPQRLAALCHSIPEAQFRVDLSSTELREAE